MHVPNSSKQSKVNSSLFSYQTWHWKPINPFDFSPSWWQDRWPAALLEPPAKSQDSCSFSNWHSETYGLKLCCQCILECAKDTGLSKLTKSFSLNGCSKASTAWEIMLAVCTSHKERQLKNKHAIKITLCLKTEDASTLRILGVARILLKGRKIHVKTDSRMLLTLHMYKLPEQAGGHEMARLLPLEEETTQDARWSELRQKGGNTQMRIKCRNLWIMTDDIPLAPFFPSMSSYRWRNNRHSVVNALLSKREFSKSLVKTTAMRNKWRKGRELKSPGVCKAPRAVLKSESHSLGTDLSKKWL